MKEWFATKKNTLLFILSVCVALILTVWIIVGLINGTISVFLKNLWSILSPIVIGFIITYLCNPIVNWLEKYPFRKIKRFAPKRLLSIFLTFILLILVIYLIFIQFIPEAIDAIYKLWSTYIINYEESIRSAAASINQFISNIPILNEYEINADVIIKWINELNVEKLITEIENKFLNSGNGTTEGVFSTIGYIFSIGSAVFTGIKDFFIGLFISFYMLISKEKSKAQARRFLHAFLSPKKARGVIRFGKLMDHSFGGFIEGKLIDSFIIGLISYLAFLIFDIPSPYVLAIIIGFTDLIPIFGPIIGSIPCAVIVLLIDPSKVLWFILLIIIIQQVEGNIISPLILGDRVNISSLSVIISIVVMGGLFGITGMLIGVPVFAVAIHLISEWTVKKLSVKNMSADLEDYYVGDTEEHIETNDRSNKLIVKIFNWIVNFFKKLWSKIFKKKDKDSKK